MNERDQDVKCPDCGEDFAMFGDGTGECQFGQCASVYERRSKRYIAALCNQRTPGTVEIDADRWSEVVRAHVERDRRATIQVSLRG